MNESAGQRRTKVCILTSVHIPFDGRIFHKEAKSLAKAGYEVVLIARHDKAEVVDGVRMVPLPEPRNRLQRMTTLLWRLYCLAVREDADVYHFHDPELMPIGLLLKLRHRRVIWDVHEHYPNSILDKFWIPQGLRRCVSRAVDLFERLVVRWYDHVIYTTPFVGARYKKLKVRSSPIENYPMIRLAEGLKRDPQERIVYVGVMSRIRGLVEVIEAFSTVVQRYPSWELCLLGTCRPASFETQLQTLAEARGIAENVKFVPWVPYDQKEKFLAQAAMGVITYLPYANNTSCLPNKLFDYMLMGLPVIASDFPLYREVVEPHRCGLIVAPEKPEQIAEAMMYLIEHPQEASVMGENGRRAVLETYNWEQESAKLLRIYEAVLGPGRGQ